MIDVRNNETLATYSSSGYSEGCACGANDVLLASCELALERLMPALGGARAEGRNDRHSAE